MLNSRGLRLQQKVLQSPMAGCTDLAYRTIARRFGCELAFCEMVKDRSVLEENDKTKLLLATDDQDHPLGMQLLGREPDTLAEAAKVLEGLGADVIDLNLGCPVNKVVKTQCGSALLREPDQVKRIFDKLVPAVKIPVTMKMRTGFDEGDDDRFLEVARIADRSGVAAITAHGRTRAQLYRGMSNHDAIRAVKQAVTIPVIGNGDLRRGADAVRMVKNTGCDGVMLARGALGNPWLYRECQAALAGEELDARPTVADRAEVLREHFALMRGLYGDDSATRRARKVIAWFIKGVAGGAELRDRGMRVSSPADMEALIVEFGRREPAEHDAPPDPAEAA